MTPGKARLNFILILMLLLVGVSAPAEKTKQKNAPDINHKQEDKKTEQEDFKIKVDVDLVTTDVTVVGAPLTELRAEDFIIYDNNVAQEISFYSRDQLPLAIAILIDSSGSIIPYLRVLQLAAVSALRHLKTEDQVALFSFSYNDTKLSDLTEDRALIAEKIGNISVGGSTNVYDSICNTVRYLKKNAPGRRRAIILISDNMQTMPSRNNAQDCLVELLESATTLFNIRVSEGDDRFHSISESDSDVKQLAEQTGGEVLTVLEPASLKTALENAISNLRMQCTLGFNPSNPGAHGSFHRLTVQLADKNRCPDCRLTVRKGYYAGVAAPPSPQANKITKPPRYSPQETDQLLVQRIILMAGTAGFEMSDIPLMISTSEETDAYGTPRLRIALKINLSGIDLSTPKDGHDCKLHVVIIYANDKRKILGYDWKTIDGIPKKEISYSIAIPLKTDNQITKIVVYDEGSDKMSSKFIQFKNEDQKR
jgi:Ca-activated chloride channel homolog